MRTYILTLAALLQVPLAALHAASPFLQKQNLLKPARMAIGPAASPAWP